MVSYMIPMIVQDMAHDVFMVIGQDLIRLQYKKQIKKLRLR